MLGVDEGGSGGSSRRTDEVYHRGQVGQQVLGGQVAYLQLSRVGIFRLRLLLTFNNYLNISISIEYRIDKVGFH